MSAPPTRSGRLARHALRLLGPALLVVLLVRMPDRGLVACALAGADLAPLLLAAALNALNLQAKVARWDALLRTRGVHYPRARAWAAYLGSTYVGMLTPGRAGDVLRAQYLRHDAGVDLADGLASVVVDRICDLYVLLGFAAFGAVRFGPALTGDLAFVTWLVVAGVAVGPLALLIPGIADGVFRRAHAKLGGDPEGSARFLGSVRAQARRGLAWTLPLTVLAFAVNYAQGWLIARALHLEMSVLDVTCLMAIASLLGLIPISVSGVGVRELFFAVAFPALGLAAEAGVSFGIAVFAVLYLTLVLVGFVSWQIAPPPTARRARPAGDAGRSR